LKAHRFGAYRPKDSPNQIEFYIPGLNWSTAAGKPVNDFEVYWNYADRGAGDMLPIGMWRLRLSHYAAIGKMKQAPQEDGCRLEMDSIADRRRQHDYVLGVDSQWSYESNRRLEPEYLTGIGGRFEAW